MRKKCLLSFAIFAFCHPLIANTTQTYVTEAELTQLKQQWLAEWQLEQKKQAQQRANFVQLEKLLKNAESQHKISDSVLFLANQLKNSDYPLYGDAEGAILKAELSVNKGDAIQAVKKITDFANQYPTVAKRLSLTQLPFQFLYQVGEFGALVEYAQKTPTFTLENQCRVLNAQFQLANAKQKNPPNSRDIVPELQTLLTDFDAFWLKTANIPNECREVEQYWQNQGLKTAEKIRHKAITLIQTSSGKGLAELVEGNTVAELTPWLKAIKILNESPSSLPDFVKNQPLDQENKTIVISMFPSFIRTLSEQTTTPDFSIYQQWAELWQLNEKEIQGWKIAFINRLFDNVDPVFQYWRDEQLTLLKVDNLTERRLRTAIWQQTPLKPWLDLLSNEGKNKAEWRYWRAKVSNNVKEQEKLLSELAKERGFYPILAAHTLGKDSPFTPPKVIPLLEIQKKHFSTPLAQIEEWRKLNRFSIAKTVWIELLKQVNFEEKLSLIDYAIQQDWGDLAVEGTIQAKAWDYIQLRFPNAYSDWFDMALTNKKISKSFAMAIARQESAWNAEARSHANALGLMQMLAGTAKQTADNLVFPFVEQDLLNPFRNIVLGTAHLSELNEKYPNNRILIASAYNAGQHRVTRWLERANGRLAMDEFIASIPFLETRNYVQNVLSYDYYYQILQNANPKQAFTPEEMRKY